MDQAKYSKACTEVITVLENIPKEYYDMIPYEKICFYKYKMDINYTYTYDPEYKNLSEYAIGILMNLHRDYWVTEDERKEILKREAKERLEIEKQKRKKYNVNNIFQNNIKILGKNTENNEFEQSMKNNIALNTELTKKQNIIQRFLSKFRKNN